MKEIKTKNDQIIEKLKAEQKVTEFSSEQKDQIFNAVEKALDDYRFDNQKKIRDSQEEIATVVLTA